MYFIYINMVAGIIDSFLDFFVTFFKIIIVVILYDIVGYAMILITLLNRDWY